MSISEVQLKRLDSPEAEEVLLESGETFLGRGPLLKIEATNISRKHVRVNIESEVVLTCLHRNPVWVKTGSGGWEELCQGKSVTFNHLDQVKFLPDSFHFQLRLREDPVTIAPQPTGLKLEKKRKLPTWMTESDSPAKKTRTPLRDVVNTPTEDEISSDLQLAGPSDTEQPPPPPPDEVKDEPHSSISQERQKTPRQSCSYGASCYRKNPVHRRDQAHPGDEDYEDPAAEVDQEDEDRPECEYGLDCYRKNPQHRKEYSHSRKPRPKRAAKVKKAAKKDKSEDEYDDSFIDDEEDGWEPVDDSDDDADYKAPGEMSSESELEQEESEDSSEPE